MSLVPIAAAAGGAVDTAFEAEFRVADSGWSTIGS
jgi:hypothetical protein